MKCISILVPTYNEQENVRPLSQAIQKEMEEHLSSYDYELIFIDNCSKDNTQKVLTSLCQENPRIKAIFNARNFGQMNSPYYGMLQTQGDCTITLCADFQDPVEMIRTFVKEWEQGYKIVCGIKTSSKENRLVRFLRTCYYKMIKRLSDVEMIEHFTGFGLYDRSFIETLRELKDPTPFLRGIVAELGPNRKEIPYQQQKRRNGKTSNNWYSLYDLAMLSFTSYTKVGLRIATMAGFFFAILGLLIALVYLIMKLVLWEDFVAGMAPVLIGVFVFGSVQMFFIGLVGEYILSINSRVMNRPLVVEAKRLNFQEPKNRNSFPE